MARPNSSCSYAEIGYRVVGGILIQLSSVIAGFWAEFPSLFPDSLYARTLGDRLDSLFPRAPERIKRQRHQHPCKNCAGLA